MFVVSIVGPAIRTCAFEAAIGSATAEVAAALSHHYDGFLYLPLLMVSVGHIGKGSFIWNLIRDPAREASVSVDLVRDHSRAYTEHEGFR